MQKEITRGTLALLVASLVLFTALTSTAATVRVGYYTLSPNPVSITTGDVVYWEEADEDFGPYIISVPSGDYVIPVGFQFPAPGTYSYTVYSSWGGGGWDGSVVVVDSSAIALTVSGVVAGNFEFNATGLTVGKSHVLQTSTNLASPANWVSVSTNVAANSTASFTNAVATGPHLFRLLELP